MSRPALSSMCRRCQSRFLTFNPVNTISQRSFSTAPRRLEEQDSFAIFEKALGKDNNPTRNSGRLPPSSSSRSSTSSSSSSSSAPVRKRPTDLGHLATGARAEASTRPSSGVSEDEPYHLNVFSHKHNMHITFTEPGRNPIISFSAGNIGLRKAQRGTFDAAYQLSTYTMRKMAEKQWRIGGKAMTGNRMLTLSEQEVRERGIEVILRGYGHGREAFQKALLGNEGRIIKPLIKRVTDGTRLKFGGTRSPQVRRLG